MESELKTFGHVQSTLTDMALRFGPKALVALAILVAGFLVARWIGTATERGLERFALEPPVRTLLVRVTRIFVLAIFVLLALQNLGVELLPLIAGVGVAGAGVALATQGVLSNVMAGLTIIFTKPYRVGESIAIVGVEGVVQEITLFSTVLVHADRSRVVVPNRKIVGEILHNYGRIRQVEVDVKVATGANLELALATVSNVVRANPRVLPEPAPVIVIRSLGEASIQISAMPWVAVSDVGTAESEISLRLLEGLRSKGVELPSQQLEVRLLGHSVP